MSKALSISARVEALTWQDDKKPEEEEEGPKGPVNLDGMIALPSSLSESQIDFEQLRAVQTCTESSELLL